jgi:nicotinate phosphoribosyltransferase
MNLPVRSLLDTDLYKLTMQQAVLELCPDAVVEYRFTNRRKDDKFTTKFGIALGMAVDQMCELQAANQEIEFLKKQCPFLKPHYLAYLANYRFNPEEVQFEITQDNDLDLVIRGPWHTTILWEVPLMATISEIFFQTCDTGWNMVGQRERAFAKGASLQFGRCHWADFATRRRRCFESQEIPVEEMMKQPNFVGTSNVHIAHKHNLRPIGTMAHEWFMGISVLEGLRHANRHALQAWRQVYNGNLGIALTDTYGSKAFWEDFDLATAKLYDGVRHDSGDPFAFADDAIARYEKLRILPETKSIVFSDSLDVDKAVQLRKHCADRIRCSFGIGTHFSNDFSSTNCLGVSHALNMVIKLWSLNGIPVVKLSDDPGKAQGDPKAIDVANWTFQR